MKGKPEGPNRKVKNGTQAQFRTKTKFERGKANGKRGKKREQKKKGKMATKTQTNLTNQPSKPLFSCRWGSVSTGKKKLIS